MGFAKEEKIRGVPDSRGILGVTKNKKNMCTAHCACHFYFPQLLSHTLSENLVSFVSGGAKISPHHCEVETA